VAITVVGISNPIDSNEAITYTIVDIVLRRRTQCFGLGLEPTYIIDPKVVKIDSPEVSSVNSHYIVSVQCGHVRHRLQMLGRIGHTRHNSHIW